MRRIQGFIVAILLCLALHGCNAIRTDSASMSKSDMGSIEGKNYNAAKASTPFDLWKSCVELAHPDDGLSEAAFHAAIQNPSSGSQVLQNLKLVQDQKLMFRPMFYSDSMLRGFFGGDNWKSADSHPYGNAQAVKFITTLLLGDAPQRMTISLESNCEVANRGTANEQSISIFGLMDIEISGGEPMTLRGVREVFGHESQLEMDPNVSPEGNVYAPAFKDIVDYIVSKEGFQLRATFFLKADREPEVGEGASESLSDDDIVAGIEMRDGQYFTLRNRQ